MRANRPDELGQKYKRWGTTQLCNALRKKPLDYTSEEAGLMLEILKSRARNMADQDVIKLSAPQNPDDFNNFLGEELNRRGLSQNGEAHLPPPLPVKADTTNENVPSVKRSVEPDYDGGVLPPASKENDSFWMAIVGVFILALLLLSSLSTSGQKRSHSSPPVASMKNEPKHEVAEPAESESWAKKSGELFGKIKNSELSQKISNQVDEFKKGYEEGENQKK